MSNSPANLGSAFAPVGFVYDPTGFNAFVAASQRGQAIMQSFSQAQQQQAAAAQQQAASQQQSAAVFTVSNAGVRQQASLMLQLAAANTDAAGRVDLYKRALALLTVGSNDYLKMQLKLIQAEKDLAREQDQANRAAARAQQQLGRAAAPAQAPTAAGAGIGGQGLVEAAGAFGLATSVPQIIGQLANVGQAATDLAVRAQTVGIAFESSTKRAGIASDELLNRLRAASRGTASDVDLMSASNRALALGVGQNAQQIADLLTVARIKGKQFGEDTTQAFNDISVGLGRLSPRILDNLGIILDETKIYADYAGQIGKASAALTDQEKRQALVNELLRTNRDLLDSAGNAALEYSDQIQQANARIQNAQTRIGQVTAPAKAAFLTGTADILELLGSTPPEVRIEREIASTTRTLEEYRQKLAEVRRTHVFEGDALTVLEDARLRWDVLTDAEVRQIQAQRELAHQAEVTRNVMEGYAESQRRWAEATGNTTQAAKDMATALRAQEGVFDAAGNALPGASSASAAALTQAATQHAQYEEIIARDQRRGNFLNEVIKAGEDIKKATTKRDDDLSELQTKHQERVHEILKRGTADDNGIVDGALTERQKLINRQHQAEIEDQYQFNEQMKIATAEGQAAQAQSTESFIDRLFELARGQRGKQVRDAALGQLKAAQAEAAELAKTDPQAAAALLAERQRQIITGIEFDRKAARLRTDARRGGGISGTDVEAEIKAEGDALKGANKAAIDAIKTGATERGKIRDHEKDKRKADNKQAVTDFDVDTQALIDKEGAAYDEAGKRIKQAFTDLVKTLKAQLALDGANIDLLPEEAQRRKLEALAPTLADAFGKKFVERLRIYMEQNPIQPNVAAPVVPGTPSGTGTIYNGQPPAGSAVNPALAASDPRLIPQAAQIVVPGGTEHDTFHAIRTNPLTGQQEYHQGLDIAANEGTPIRFPSRSGKVYKVGSSPQYGNNVQILDEQGRLWYFGHIQRALVKVGDLVSYGQAVALVGHTGADAIGNHVHVQLRPKLTGAPIDPTDILNEIARNPSLVEPSDQAGRGASGATPPDYPDAPTRGATGPTPPEPHDANLARFAGQSFGGYRPLGSAPDLWSMPALWAGALQRSAQPLTPATKPDLHIEVHLDLRGASGIDATLVKEMAREGAEAAAQKIVDAYEYRLRQEIVQSTAAGPPRTS